MLGPSGCGKTTTLRLIAGFERPDEGAILLDGVDMSRTPPHKRNVNTVFQSYALFPHKSVADNIAFGLRYKKVDQGRDTQRRVDEAMELVRLQGLGERRPAQLSGGQQQRVALARALVLEPPVLLLDEPLGALDARLRIDLQVELKRIQEQLEVTFIYVTHDQDEALTMSDRVAVMRDGRIEQCAAPQELYEQPETAFVANFLGAANLVPVTARPDGDGADADARRLHAAQRRRLRRSPATALAMIRPEYVRIEPHGTTGENRVPGHGRGGRLPRLPPGRARAPGDRRARARRRPERRRGARVRAGRRRGGAPAPAQPAGARRRRGRHRGRDRGRRGGRGRRRGRGTRRVTVSPPGRGGRSAQAERILRRAVARISWRASLDARIARVASHDAHAVAVDERTSARVARGAPVAGARARALAMPLGRCASANHSCMRA